MVESTRQKLNKEQLAMMKRALNLRRWPWILGTSGIVIIIFSLVFGTVGFAAYNHAGETDSANFRTAYPAAVGTKLDSCTLCHVGGSYVSGGKSTTLGSCQWCHYSYGYNAPHGDILGTLNQYGKDYLSHGRNASALQAIQNQDPDTDGYSSALEIASIRYPGDSRDTPAKVAAPYRVFSRSELEKMPQYSEYLLMNASKSTDYYAQYSGVTVEDLLKGIMLDSATGITVYAPDGFSQTHPLNPSADPSSYHVIGSYPAEKYYYSEQADIAKNPSTGWADFSAPSSTGRHNGDPIVNANGLKMLLAIKRDGQYLTPGVLNAQNKLDGEGPFRIIPPQKNPGPPDQRSTASNAADPNVWIWPYIANADHNAGFSSRTVTIIRVDPLPPGTTDIDLLEAGWPYVDQDKIVVYGAINPIPTVQEKLDLLAASIRSADSAAFTNKGLKTAFNVEVDLAKKLVIKGAEIEANSKNPSHNPKLDDIKKKLAAAAYSEALKILNENVMKRTDGYALGGAVDKNDWVVGSEAQKQFYWAIKEIVTLLDIKV
jgi:hypothetical protein